MKKNVSNCEQVVRRQERTKNMPDKNLPEEELDKDVVAAEEEEAASPGNQRRSWK